MIRGPKLKASFESASGLRLAAAFLLILIVLGVVALKAFVIAVRGEAAQPRALTEQRSSEVTFDLVDRSGVPLALSIERQELVAYPCALWQAHTPNTFIPELARILGWSREQAIAALLPENAVNGWITVEKAPFRLDDAQARAIQGWIARGSLDPEAPANPVAGMEIRQSRAGEWQLRWNPLLVLSPQVREQHKAASTVAWTRRIGDELITCLVGREQKRALDGDPNELRDMRQLVWGALFPLQYKVLKKEVEPEVSMRLYEFFKAQRVRSYQIKLVPINKRTYPPRAGGADELPMAVLGAWGMLDAEDARARARQELLLPTDRPLGEDEEAELEARTLLRLNYPSPVSGLELAAYDLLQQPEFDWVETDPERYYFLASYVPRRSPRRHFQDLDVQSPTPRVITTLDLALQRHMRVVLEDISKEHKPAMAMAIALEVASGRVLAVESVSEYGVWGFMPALHVFTPGSTMKTLVMATAVDTRAIDPEHDTIDTHRLSAVLEGKRKIGEAEGAKHGHLTPEQALAYSSNAAMVQIGLRTNPFEHYKRLKLMGYGDYPHAGLGPERKGSVPTWPWDKIFKHASTSIGHELGVTMWQHAAGLAALVRGGLWRPLRLIDAVEQNGRIEALPEPEGGTRIWSEATAASLRSMMNAGARYGTGRFLYTDEILMGTKTGTAQKVGNEVCLHAELEYNQHHQPGTPRLTRKELLQRKPHRGNCYTCSIVVFGRLPDSEREVLVFVVVEEPRGAHHYGSDTAGPGAMSILKEALGLTRGGVPVHARDVRGFAPLVDEKLGPKQENKPKNRFVEAAAKQTEQPWKEAQRAPH